MRSSRPRSEEHTSELQSPCNLVCRLLLEKKKKRNIQKLNETPTTHHNLCKYSHRKRASVTPSNTYRGACSLRAVSHICLPRTSSCSATCCVCGCRHIFCVFSLCSCLCMIFSLSSLRFSVSSLLHTFC